MPAGLLTQLPATKRPQRRALRLAAPGHRFGHTTRQRQRNSLLRQFESAFPCRWLCKRPSSDSSCTRLPRSPKTTTVPFSIRDSADCWQYFCSGADSKSASRRGESRTRHPGAFVPQAVSCLEMSFDSRWTCSGQVRCFLWSAPFLCVFFIIMPNGCLFYQIVNFEVNFYFIFVYLRILRLFCAKNTHQLPLIISTLQFFDSNQPYYGLDYVLFYKYIFHFIKSKEIAIYKMEQIEIINQLIISIVIFALSIFY